MKYVCFGYYDKDKFEGMTTAEQNAMFDTCLDYDDRWTPFARTYHSGFHR